MSLRHPRSTLFPYTTLFRSDDGVALAERLGAKGVVEGHLGDIARSAREYAPDGFDAAFLTVGGEPAEKALIAMAEDRKSTRLNSSHVEISYAVFCLKKKRND